MTPAAYIRILAANGDGFAKTILQNSSLVDYITELTNCYCDYCQRENHIFTPRYFIRALFHSGAELPRLMKDTRPILRHLIEEIMAEYLLINKSKFIKNAID
jgi:hypothetical protein